MSRFTKGSRRVDFGDGEWIEIRKKLSFREVMAFKGIQDKSGEEASIDFLFKCITAWNLKDDSGNEVPFSRDTLLDLDMDIINELVKECAKVTGVSETKIQEKKDEESWHLQ